MVLRSHAGKCNQRHIAEQNKVATDGWLAAHPAETRQYARQAWLFRRLARAAGGFSKLRLAKTHLAPASISLCFVP